MAPVTGMPEHQYWANVPGPVSVGRQAILDVLCHGRPIPIGQAKAAAINLAMYLSAGPYSRASAGVSKSFNSMALSADLIIDGFEVSLPWETARKWRELREKMLAEQPHTVRAGHIAPINPGGFPETLLWKMAPPEQGLMIGVADCGEYVAALRQSVHAHQPPLPIGLVTCNANSHRLRVYVAEEHGERAKAWLVRELGNLGGPTIGIALNRKAISWRPIDLLPAPWYEAIVQDYTNWLVQRMRVNDMKQLAYHLSGDNPDIQQWVAGEVLEMLVRYDDTRGTGSSMTFPAFALKRISQAVQDLQRETITRKGADIQKIVNTYAAEHGIEPSQVPDHVVADAAQLPIAHARALRANYLTASAIHAPGTLDAPLPVGDGAGNRYDTIASSGLDTTPAPQDPVALAAVHAADMEESRRMHMVSRLLVNAGDDAGDPLGFFTIYAANYLNMQAQDVASLALMSEDDLADRVTDVVREAKNRYSDGDFAPIDR